MALDPAFATSVLRELARTKRGTTIAFGAGQRTLDAFQADPAAARAAIDAVVDEDPARIGTPFCGYTVTSPERLLDRTITRVLICSEMFEAQLTRRARELFGNVEIITAFDRSASLPSQLARAQHALAAQWHAPNDREALWLTADRLMTDLHDRLSTTPEWRYGPLRQREEFRQLRAVLAQHDIDLTNAHILNAGCGRYHPIGQSLLAIAAGAASAHAIDIEAPLDAPRSARAAGELVANLLLDPADFAITRTELLARLEAHLDLVALTEGNLSAGLPHHVGSIMDTTLAPRPFDVIFSRDVFEHIHDVAGALCALRTRLAPAGVLILWIDFSDHRRYANPGKFAHWTNMLASEPTSERPDTNGWRLPHYRRAFAENGFSVLQFEATETEPIPAHVQAEFAPMYQALALDDLAVCRAVAVLRPVAVHHATHSLQHVHQ